MVNIFFSLFVLTGMCQPIEKDTIKVFYLGGQSNMDGYEFNSHLPNYLKHEFKSVWIFHGNPAPDERENGGLGKWDRLRPGHGVGFSSDGTDNKLSNRFGIELSFAKRLQELFPNEKIWTCKIFTGRLFH